MFNLFNEFKSFALFSTGVKRTIPISSDNFIIVSSDNFIITGRS